MAVFSLQFIIGI